MDMEKKKKRPPVCLTAGKIGSNGFFYAVFDRKWSFAPIPVLALQMTALSLAPRVIHILLSRFDQPLFVSQLLGGILFSPWVLGRFKYTSYLFPVEGNDTLDTLALFSSMFFLFKVGVQMDPRMLRRAGKRAYIIGFSCYFISLVSGLCAGHLIDKSVGMLRIRNTFKFFLKITNIFSITSFPVIACVLTDLNILNSDLGHLATSAAMISDILHLAGQIVYLFGKLYIDSKSGNEFYMILAFFGMVIYILYIVRPFSLWVVRRTPEGSAVKEFYVSCMFISTLLCGLASEYIGINATVGTFFLGLAIPEGPPLGATLVDKLDYLVTVFLMPLHMGILGTKTNIDKLEAWFVWRVVLIICACVFGKILGVIVPALYLGVPVRDSFLLGLIMNLKGIVEVSMLNVWVDAQTIDIATNTIMVITILVITAAITPVVKNLYDPSTKYLSYKRRSILHSKQNLADFRILVCVHNQGDVPPIIRLLEASNPTNINPLSVFILHLVELVGRASPLFIAHPPQKRSSSNPSKSERIINAFRQFEKRNHGVTTIQAFSTISPYASMHNDICSMSVDKRTSLIIFPFQSQAVAGLRDGSASSERSIKTILQNLLRNSPCSLGILIDGNHHHPLTTSILSNETYRVTVLFFGGPDDREALAYAMNMIHHPSVFITVVRFFAAALSSSPDDMNYYSGSINIDFERQKLLDDELIDHFRVKTMHDNKSVYKEVEVKDGSETVWIIRTLKDDFDLMMVGRQQITDSIITAGLNDEWSEHEELGVIGDMVSAPDYSSEGSILIVHQRHE